MVKKLTTCTIAVVVFFLVSCLSVLAQEGTRRQEARMIMDQIHQHQREIKDLKAQLRQMHQGAGGGYGEEGAYEEEYAETDYSDEGDVSYAGDEGYSTDAGYTDAGYEGDDGQRPHLSPKQRLKHRAKNHLKDKVREHRDNVRRTC